MIFSAWLCNGNILITQLILRSDSQSDVKCLEQDVLEGFFIQNLSLRWMVRPTIFSETTNLKENPFIVELLSWKTFYFQKDILLAYKFFFQCLNG